MRAMIEAEARADYSNLISWNGKLQGRYYDALRQFGYADRIDTGKPPLLSYSSPIPPRDANEGDVRRFIVAANDPVLVTAIVADLCSDTELNVGHMPFEVKEGFSIDAPVRDRGELVTGTPIVVSFSKHDAAKLGVETKYDSTYWKPEHGLDILRDKIQSNLAWKYELAHDEEPPDPPYFDGISVGTEVAKPIKWGEGNHDPSIVIGHEMQFSYSVRSAEHRKILSVALDAGLGQSNGAGWGFLNRVCDVNGAEPIFEFNDELDRDSEAEDDASIASSLDTGYGNPVTSDSPGSNPDGEPGPEQESSEV